MRRPTTQWLLGVGLPLGLMLAVLLLVMAAATGARAVEPHLALAPNAPSGNIVVRKTTIPGGSAAAFNFTASYTQAFTLRHGEEYDSGQIDTGNHWVAESVPGGWDLAASCDGGNTPGAINLGNNQTVTCIFTNTQLSSIRIVKNATPKNAQHFSFTTASGPDTALPATFQLSDDGIDDNFDEWPNLKAGTYTVTEDGEDGWHFTGLSCIDPTGDSIWSGATASIALGVGETVTCTFENTKRSRILVDKVTDPTSSTQPFSFATNYTDTFSLTGPAPVHDSGDLVAGTSYTVTEISSPAGWDLVSSLCTGAGGRVVPSNAIDLQPYETVTCIFNNRIQRGRILIDKVTDPADSSQVFTFTTSYAGDLHLTGPGAANDSGDLLPSSEAGNHSVVEDFPAGWDQVSGACTGQGGRDVNSDAIDLQPGETVTCTFDNRIRRGRILVDKVTDPAGSSQAFTFTSSYTDTFVLTDSSLAHDSGELLPSSESGNYSVTESLPNGWEEPVVSCTGQRNRSVDADAIDLRPGETVSCAFNNRIQRGQIVVNKETEPADSTQVFSFTSSYTDDFTLTGPGPGYGSGELLPSSETGAIYTVTETSILDGWELTSALCVSSMGGGVPPNAISLQPGETLTCTFENLGRGEVEVTKQVIWNEATPDPGQTFSVCLEGPAFPFAPDCKDFSSGTTQRWPELVHGVYTVTEVSPSGAWADQWDSVVSESPFTVYPPPEPPVSVVVTNTFSPFCDVTQITETDARVANVQPSIAGASQQVRIAYVSADGADRELYLADLDTTLPVFVPQLIRITSTPGGVTNEHPAISGDGGYVALTSDGDLDPTGLNSDGNPEIYRYDVNGASFSLATNTPAAIFPGLNATPDTSDLGARIAFVSDHDLVGLNADLNIEVFVRRDHLKVSAGLFHSCRLRDDGNVACWGADWYGQAAAPQSAFRQVSAGAYHSCGLREDDSVECWGAGAAGSSGGPDFGQSAPPSGPFRQVSAGDYHTCGLRADGNAACWGNNWYGQAPLARPGPYLQLSAGGFHTCGLRDGGDVECWGYNAYGQSSPPSGTFAQLDAGGLHTCGLRSDDSAECWGYNAYGQAPPAAGTFAQLDAGGYHTCGLRGDGSIVCWGFDAYGQAMPPSGSFAQLGAGGYHTCGVRDDGSLDCWGYDAYGQSSPPGEGLSISQLTVSTLSTNSQPSISADGRYVAFVSDGDLDPAVGNVDRNPEIFVSDLDADPVAVAQVTDSGLGVGNGDPTISDDGSRIAFLTTEGGHAEIFVAELDTSLALGVVPPVIVQVTDTAAGLANGEPAISGDGRFIVFTSDGELASGGNNSDRNLEIFVAALDVEPIAFRQVASTTVDVVNQQPTINRLGDRIAFVSTADPDGNQEIYLAGCNVNLPAVDLSVTKSGQDTAITGQWFPYSISVSNNDSEASAYGIVLSDTLVGPALLVPAGPACSEAHGGVACQVDALAPGSTETFTIWARVDAAGSGGATQLITNTVKVIAASPDHNPANDTDYLTTTVVEGTDIEVQKRTFASGVSGGVPLTYTVTVNNNVGSTTRVAITDTLTTSVSVVQGPVNIPGATCSGWQGNSFVCTYPSLQAGATISFTLTITPQRAGVITNTVEVASEIDDPIQNNNRAQVVLGPPPVYLPIILSGHAP